MKKITKFDIDTSELIADAIMRFDWPTNKCNNIGEFCEVLIWGGTKQAPAAYKKGYEGIVYSVLSEAGMDPDKDIHAIDNVIRDINKDVADAAVKLSRELVRCISPMTAAEAKEGMSPDFAAELCKISIGGKFENLESEFGKIGTDIKNVVDFKRLGAYYLLNFKGLWRISGMISDSEYIYSDPKYTTMINKLKEAVVKKYEK